MNRRAERRGQPIVALATIVSLWCLARIVVWTWGAEPNRFGGAVRAPARPMSHHRAGQEARLKPWLMAPPVSAWPVGQASFVLPLATATKDSPLAPREQT